MEKISSTFAKLAAEGRRAFIPYLAAGVPGADETVELVLALENWGADIIELGYPFSDPMADGVVNQTAANVALEKGVDVDAYFSMIEKIRLHSRIPLVVFSYLNPIHKIGFEAFVRQAASLEVDGLLLVDMPVEESEEVRSICARESLCNIYLLAPTTTPKRRERVLKDSSGFVYYVSRTGITGEQEGFQQSFEEKLGAVKKASPLPVAVGFGISTPAQVRTVCGLADGVVVGSALVRRTLENKPFPTLMREMEAFAKPLIAPTKELWT